MNPDQLRDVLQRLLAAAPDMPHEVDPPVSRRRPRRQDVVTYRVRVDLQETKPPLWRRLELASDLFLDEVHEIIQIAFGWTDTHLHRFAAGPQPYGPETEHYLGPFEVAEGEAGVPEDEVRLDEVLVDVGDRLFYAYDFGDDWQHTIKLEAVSGRDDRAPRAVCTAGRRPDPVEDCGGVYGLELIAAATDQARPDHAEGLAEFARFYGDDVDPMEFQTTPFDVEETNQALAALDVHDLRAEVESSERTSPPGDLPGPLADLLDAVRSAPERRRLRRLIGAACLGEAPQVDAETAAGMAHPWTWLLDRVGTGGIQLTGAGYLPPAHVTAAVAALGLDEEWIGKGNREIQTLPVLHLRESAQRAGCCESIAVAWS